MGISERRMSYLCTLVVTFYLADQLLHLGPNMLDYLGYLYAHWLTLYLFMCELVHVYHSFWLRRIISTDVHDSRLLISFFGSSRYIHDTGRSFLQLGVLQQPHVLCFDWKCFSRCG